MTELNEIVPAIAAATGQMQKVGKEGRNKHDGYNFASIDDFLALVNPICAANGLIIWMQESSIEDFARKGKNGETSWLRVTWEIVVYHSSGQSLPPVKRTVEVLRNGAQAYGSSQSYALKQFLRSLLLIPTGDADDADLQPTDSGAVAGPVSSRRRMAQQPATVTDEQAAILHDLATHAEANTAKAFAHLGISAWHELPAARYEKVRAQLQHKVDEASVQRDEDHIQSGNAAVADELENAGDPAEPPF